jgi:hypothetical protein
MKLFFKHLLRSTVKKPLQPILLTLTLALAVMASIFTLTLDRMIDQENRSLQAVTYGSADLTVTLDGASTSRFMFVKDAEKILGESAKVAGCFSLPLAIGEQQNAVSGVAVDFSQIERIFDFSFIEYGILTPSGVKEAAFVTKSFADANGLCCGDRFTAAVLGKMRTYTVVGISEAPLIASHDVIVDISGIVRLIAGDSLLLASMKDGFRPCSTIYIDLLSGTSAEAMQKLSASPAFAANTFTDVSNAVEKLNNAGELTAVLDIAVLLCCILAAAVAFCCLYILSHERTEENRSFMLSGARALHLHLLQYAEVLGFWLLGSVLGVFLARGLSKIFIDAAGFRFATAQLYPTDAVLGISMIFITAMLTVLVFTSSERMRRTEKKRKKPYAIFVPALALVLFVLVFVLPVKIRFFLYIPAILFFALTIFLYAAPLTCVLTRFMDCLLENQKKRKGQGRFVSLHYAIKNVFSVSILHNTARLLSLLIFVVAGIGSVMLGAVGHVHFTKNSFAADYAVLGGTESCYEKVSACEAVESCHKLYMQNAETDGGSPLMILAASDMQAVSKRIRPMRAPKGNYAAVSVGEANAQSLDIGDRITVRVAEQDIVLEVGEILDVSLRCVILDNEYFDLHYNMLGVVGKAGVSEAALMGALSAETASELAAVMRTEELWDQKMETLEIYLASGFLLLFLVIVFALIGTLDNLGQSYRARRGEFHLYRLSGMSRAQVRRMKCAEILMTVLFALVPFGVMFPLFLLLTNTALRSYAYEMILSLKLFFDIL